MAREVVRALLAAGKPGAIINMSSQMGHVGGPRRTLYCASKHAVEGMTKALAWEVGRQGIRVNTLCPTFIETEFTARMFSDRPSAPLPRTAPHWGASGGSRKSWAPWCSWPAMPPAWSPAAP